ncbi:unnamed protein product (macronuclear) [Paramecium tetraurelia]|uniref:Uncharacterized protein n=1 Tax=Paramecium tetraurelia TaxID=5888 RepID=A0DYJ6_PARTE|nr:uncharacterized protein GSPATT00003081001 [Paramecium tetraurelia]CAK88113.1 unnamed protein product [Paramecium tetraurelia]|eukprot:XP_001455510.1 hypothetical protein (macronuclear) [Paramecium tetraurelia strain d4-2]
MLILVIYAKVIPIKIQVVRYLVVHVFNISTWILIIIVYCVILLVNNVGHRALHAHPATSPVTREFTIMVVVFVILDIQISGLSNVINLGCGYGCADCVSGTCNFLYGK